MHPKTASQIFKEWLDTATLEELEEEALDLEDVSNKILSQIERYEAEAKTGAPAPENQDWRLRAGHAQRQSSFQTKAIRRKIHALDKQSSLDRDSERRRDLLVTEELRLEQTKVSLELKRLAHDAAACRAAAYDQDWIQAAKKFLDRDTFMQITALAGTPMDGKAT